MFSVGFNNHMEVDNVITLLRSSNDIFDGTLDYIYFKVLGCDPVTYFNLIDEDELTEQEKDEYQFYFEEYEKKHLLLMNENFCIELKKLIFHLRDISVENNIIKEELGYYISNNNKFSLRYVMKEILRFYRGRTC